MRALQCGRNIIKEYTKHLEARPGVYRMLGEAGDVLYVGKAVKLKNRVASYTHIDGLAVRLQRMVSLTKSMLFVYTESEAHALLLEADLIKSLKPKFNIMLRDDKSYPAIMINTRHAFPRIIKYRGPQNTKQGMYFGPFSDVMAVRRTIKILRQAFLLRNCTDYTFKARTRPCLQYQIHCCSAPCVGYKSYEEYKKDVHQVINFLNGRQHDVIKTLETKMNRTAKDQKYEQSIIYRNQLKDLGSILQQHHSPIVMRDDCDVFAFLFQEQSCYISVFFLRSGLHYGNHLHKEMIPEDIPFDFFIEQFLMQWYEDKTIPKTVLLNRNFSNSESVQEALTLKAEKRIFVSVPIKGDRKKLIDWALDHARIAMEKNLKEAKKEQEVVQLLCNMLNKKHIYRIEAYDNSHLRGSYSTGAMIVYKVYQGFVKNEYRQYTIDDPTIKEDDYGMMRYVLRKRLQHLVDDPKAEHPDLLLIDGGANQLREATQILTELQLMDIQAIGVAKGLNRNKSQEKIYIDPSNPPLTFDEDDSLLFFIERIRDEVHRFVITSHRKKRSKGFIKSTLDDIPGIGAKRRKSLMLYFGSVRSISVASQEELTAVPGISVHQADTIYHWFH